VIAVATAGAMRLERRPDRRASFARPAAQSSALVSTPPPVPAALPMQTASGTPPNVPVPKPDSTLVAPAVTPTSVRSNGVLEQSERPRRRRSRPPALDTIQYGADGLPILH
jgi:hypothetical protein